MIPYVEGQDVIGRRLTEALESVGMKAGASACASWLDLSIPDVGEALVINRLGGVVPCRSLWDANGKKLAAVLVFDTAAIT